MFLQGKPPLPNYLFLMQRYMDRNKDNYVIQHL